MTGFSSNVGPDRVVKGSFDPQNPCFAQPAIKPQWHVTLAEKKVEHILVITLAAFCFAAFLGYLLYARPEIDRGHWTQYFFWFMFLASLLTGGLGIKRLRDSRHKN